uniref:Uncharacterized protein n=1 Tax=Anguilla anguilla TaxID=7936 RepID=A0A0E9VJ40_ANGAN
MHGSQLYPRTPRLIRRSGGPSHKNYILINSGWGEIIHH